MEFTISFCQNWGTPWPKVFGPAWIQSVVSFRKLFLMSWWLHLKSFKNLISVSRPLLLDYNSQESYLPSPSLHLYLPGKTVIKVLDFSSRYMQFHTKWTMAKSNLSKDLAQIIQLSWFLNFRDLHKSAWTSGEWQKRPESWWSTLPCHQLSPHVKGSRFFDSFPDVVYE